MVPHTWRKAPSARLSMTDTFICDRCGLSVNCNPGTIPDQTVRQHIQRRMDMYGPRWKERAFTALSECCDEMLVIQVTQSLAR